MFLCFVKVGLVNAELGYLPEEIFKPNVEGIVWFLLAAHSDV